MNERETVSYHSSIPPDALGRHGRTSGGLTSIIVSSIARWKLVAIRKIRELTGPVVNGVRAESDIGIASNAPPATILTDYLRHPADRTGHLEKAPQNSQPTAQNENRPFRHISLCCQEFRWAIE